MFDTTNLNKKLDMLLPVVAYDSPGYSVMAECVICFSHHVMLVTAPVSCCNSPAGRALVFPLCFSPKYKDSAGWKGWHIGNSFTSVAQYPASAGLSCQTL